MVDSSECLLAIFGENVPPITSEEIIRAFERRRTGSAVDFWLFLDAGLKTKEHEEFLDRIKSEFGEQIVYTPYETELQFQAAVAMTLVEYVARRLKRRPALGRGRSR